MPPNTKHLIKGKKEWEEPRETPKRAKRNEMEGQSLLTLELSTTEPKDGKKGIKLQSQNKKGKPIIFATKSKAREKKSYLKRTVLERKNMIEIIRLEEGKHRATMVLGEKSEEEREKQNSLKSWA